ncbi:MAG: hypothetical protein PUB81_03735 [Clostridiales bacterium]|nr:hypothetical protein [Eubacteriales bacterium]MDD6054436.1 hypothetical protein [Clostridiales bacterium]MDD7506539.1 hypothetical protein [Clostridiales bacterium]MDY5677884.1 hypothetical protein [Eubacteriales bacterium]MDY5725950.1 hypothetical protein [Eubacteriales bacterium]
MDYSFLIGMTQEEAIDFLNKKNLSYSLLFTQDKKNIGNDNIVVAVRSAAEKIILIVGRFLLKVVEEKADE